MAMTKTEKIILNIGGERHEYNVGQYGCMYILVDDDLNNGKILFEDASELVFNSSGVAVTNVFNDNKEKVMIIIRFTYHGAHNYYFSCAKDYLGCELVDTNDQDANYGLGMKMEDVKGFFNFLIRMRKKVATHINEEERFLMSVFIGDLFLCNIDLCIHDIEKLPYFGLSEIQFLIQKATKSRNIILKHLIELPSSRHVSFNQAQQYDLTLANLIIGKRIDR